MRYSLYDTYTCAYVYIYTIYIHNTVCVHTVYCYKNGEEEGREEVKRIPNENSGWAMEKKRNITKKKKNGKLSTMEMC